MTTTRNRAPLALGILLYACLSLISLRAQDSARREHVFRGKIDKVDLNARTLTVAGEKVDGWMAAMTMTYHVDKADILAQLKAGDQISAMVRDGDFTTLYDVLVAAAKAPDKD